MGGQRFRRKKSGQKPLRGGSAGVPAIYCKGRNVRSGPGDPTKATPQGPCGAISRWDTFRPGACEDAHGQHTQPAGNFPPRPDARRQLSRAFQVPWDPRTFHPFLHSDAPGCSDQGQVRTEEASARDYLAALCSRSGRFEAWNRPRGCRGRTEGDTSSGGYRGNGGRHPGNPREATYKKNA